MTTSRVRCIDDRIIGSLPECLVANRLAAIGDGRA